MFKQTEKILLASQSDSRQKVLTHAKIDFETLKNIHSDQDEETFKQTVEHLTLDRYIQEISNFKSVDISKEHPECYVLSGDQACVLDGEEIRKPYSRSEAIGQLTSFSGKTFELVTSLTLAKNGIIAWEFQNTSAITMRRFSMLDAERYFDLEEQGPHGSLVGIAGACRIESPYGAHLIEKIDGDQYSIMGLPLHPLMAQLYKLGVFT